MIGAEATFDYVIVGAGSAGCVLANRLSESGRHTVALIEAGGRDVNPWIHIPLGYGKHFTNKAINWLYTTEPEPHCGGRRILQPRGKVLGGSSSINGLLYVRGQAEDYDYWRQLGNAGWSYRDVLPYFRKAEDQERGESEFHGTGGPLGVANPRDEFAICRAFIEAAMECGHKRNEDFNGAEQEGFGFYQMTARGGQRCSAAVAYLKPAMKRVNLEVLSSMRANRILFEGKRAVGVEFSQDGETKVVRARAEVILSCGSFNSPHLLQLSGVGPAPLLKQHGIPILAEMPHVGANMQDHYCARFIYRCKDVTTLNDVMHSWGASIAEGLRYAAKRRGFLAMPAAMVGGFFKVDPASATPEIQTHLMLFSTDSFDKPLHNFPGVSVPILLLRPESRGEVKITSADPRQPPGIYGNYLSARRDRELLLAGMKEVRRILAAPALAQYVVEEHEPGPKCGSDDELLDYLRNRGTTAYHPTTTCRMGPDPLAVVDERLRVKGIGGLRVVDASIMPSVPSGNTNAPTIMVAEKGADMILADAVAARRAA